MLIQVHNNFMLKIFFSSIKEPVRRQGYFEGKSEKHELYSPLRMTS